MLFEAWKLNTVTQAKPKTQSVSTTVIRFIDLFCGIGGFRIAMETACQERERLSCCVFSSDIDLDAQITYKANFGEEPKGDITKIASYNIPDHDILLAGFPCQAFSICGDRRGFEDTRGTLFFEIARIIAQKQPFTIVLENVKQLQSHDQGRTLNRILETLKDLGYYVHYRILNALNFGLPQKRERIFIVGFREPLHFVFPVGKELYKPLSEIFEVDVPQSYYASAQIRQNRLEKRKDKKLYDEPTIWHENKGGNISAYPYSCAMRAGASYNYLLVNGERRLTEREMLRLQGFPDTYKIVCGYSAMRKLVGNSVAVPCVVAVLQSVLDSLNQKTFNQTEQGKLNLNVPELKLSTTYLSMSVTLLGAKTRLDDIIKKARVDMYKPIQIAEVLYRSRLVGDITISDVSTYINSSIRWRDEVTLRLTGKKSTSSARFQHDIWNATAMPSDILTVLDAENKKTEGAVEEYIYRQYSERHGTVSNIIAAVTVTTPDSFQLRALLEMFVSTPGIRRSIDKAYEIVAYSLFETVITTLGATIKVSVPNSNKELLHEFSDLTRLLLGVDETQTEWEQLAHIYRVGVTNSADRGLDMWANFGPAIQVKDLTLNPKLAKNIVDHIESDRILIVCQDTDADIIKIITQQISWGKRICGIIKESDLIEWYDRCLRGKFSNKLARPLLNLLIESFKAEFPQSITLAEFLNERGYELLPHDKMWNSETDIALTAEQQSLF